MRKRRWLLWFAFAIALAVLPHSDTVPLPAIPILSLGEWVYLSDMPWKFGSTGWVAVANDDLPSPDRAFSGGDLVINGERYEKGIGVYPLSEITYTLDRRYTRFESEIGLNDLAPGVVEDSPSRVVFSVFVDGALAYDSGIVSRGMLPLPIRLPIAGASELRLVVSASGPSSIHNFADWAGARLFRAARLPDEASVLADLAALRLQASDRRRQLDDDRLALDTLAQAHSAMIASADIRVSTSASRVAFATQPARNLVILKNEHVALSYGIGGADHGLLSVLHVPTGRLLIYGADASVVAGNGAHWSLHHDTNAIGAPGYQVDDVVDPILGKGRRLAVDLAAKAGNGTLRFEVTLFEAQPYFVMQIRASGTPAESTRINYLDSLGPSNLAIGDGMHYLTDISRLRTGTVEDDGIQRREAIDQGKPVYLSGSASGLGLVMAAIDETAGSPQLALQVDPGRVMARLDFSTGPIRTMERGLGIVGSRLFVEAVPAGRPREAFANFRVVMSKLYPAAPLPEWVRYQWLSWYPYYMDIDEQQIKRQIDYIAQNLGDLGPWHIIVDAGWYVAEGRSDADWRNVDLAKFPSGLRHLVDYAHDKDVKVVLYFSAPYLDSRTARGDWLGLRALIDNHPEWLIRLGEDATRQSYVYDLQNPALRAYLADVMRDYFEVYDVDGIKIDGLGNGDGAAVSPGQRDAFGLVGKVREPALDIYRLVYDEAKRWEPNAYIESGWLNPLFANGLAHTFRYGDEEAAFSNRYPQPGLAEHVEYAIAQQAYWGQRANMGAVRGNFQLDEQWLGASLALGAQTSISFDLTAMPRDVLSRYRALLVHYRPFEGLTLYADLPDGQAFVTIKDNVAFVGVLNRSNDEREINLPLGTLGLSEAARYLAYDVSADHFSLTQDDLRVKLGPRSLRLFVLRDGPGVLWTNSSFSQEQYGSTLELTLRGPEGIAGFSHALVPDIEAVAIDGEIMTEGLDDDWPAGYSYDSRLGLLTLRYDHNTSHRITIKYGRQ